MADVDGGIRQEFAEGVVVVVADGFHERCEFWRGAFGAPVGVGMAVRVVV